MLPTFLKRSKQERIQNVWSMYAEEYRNHWFESSIKLDGESMTVYYKVDTDDFGVCMRRVNLLESETNIMWKTTRRIGLIERLRNYGKSLALQGEIIGPGINNREQLKEPSFFVFDIFDIDAGRYLTQKERFAALKALGLRDIHIPVLDPVQPFKGTLQNLLDRANGQSMNAKSREGIVLKSLELIEGSPLSFKVISNQYLLR